MKKEINGKHLDAIFKNIGYLILCGSLMGGGVTISKYAANIIQEFSTANIITGLIFAFSGLGLAVYVAVYAGQELNKFYKSKLKGIVYGLLYTYMSVTLAMAMFFAAADTNARTIQNKSTEPKVTTLKIGDFYRDENNTVIKYIGNKNFKDDDYSYLWK